MVVVLLRLMLDYSIYQDYEEESIIKAAVEEELLIFGCI